MRRSRGFGRSVAEHSAALALIFILVALAGPVLGNNYTVNSTADEPDADPSTGNCVSTPSGVCTLRAAIMVAHFVTGPNTINIPSGTYMLTRPGYDDTALVGDLDISHDLTVQGAGSGATIIDGNGSTTHDRVFHVLSSVQNMTLSGMTIRNGESLFSTVGVIGGGGLYIEGAAQVHLSDIIFDGNTGLNGGGIYANFSSQGGSLTLDHVILRANAAIAGGVGAGGGVFVHLLSSQSQFVVRDTQVYSNTADGTGGGLYVDGNSTATWSIQRTEMYSNTAASAGAIGNFVPLTLSDSRLHDNHVTFDGGAIDAYAPFTILRTTLDANSAARYGGAIFSLQTGSTDPSDFAHIEGSTLSGNSAKYGGGIYHDGFITPGSTMRLINSTVNGNGVYGPVPSPSPSPAHGAAGAGIYVYGGQLDLVNTTITENQVHLGLPSRPNSGIGGGLYVYASATLIAQNSLIANNTRGNDFQPATEDDCYSSGTVGTLAYNLIRDMTNCFVTGPQGGNIVGKDPLLGSLQNNGGPTFTQALLAGSPAIDKGSSVQTTLSAAINNSTTTIAVDDSTTDDSSTIPGSNYTIVIDSEQMFVTSSTNNPPGNPDSLTVIRGVNGTTAAGHSAGASLRVPLDQRGSGFLRIFDDPAVSNAGNGSDMGAFEKQNAVATPTTTLQFSSNTYSVNEGDGTATITVTRTGDTSIATTVNYSTSNGTATAGADYMAVSATLSFASGETSKTFSVPIINDSLNEPNETINLGLSNVTGNAALSAPSTAVLTIVDDDPAPSLSINDVSVVEGNSGTTNANFTISLSSASGQPVTVSYATADGTATAGSDYTLASGMVTFTPGQTNRTIIVTVNGDTTIEPNETFFVDLSSPVNATITRSRGTGTILDDDAPPSPTPTPTPTPTPSPGTLGNISTRLQVGTGNNVLFAGFIVQGNASKTVLIRSAGPSLASFGVAGVLANPQLELHDASNTIGTNDNWQTTQIGGVITTDQVAAIRNSGAAPADPAEPAIIATLPAGGYTAIVKGVGGTQGVATAEVYDLSPNNGAILANISTRGFIQTGDNVMIGGFIIVGQSSRVLIRATGPSLIPFGINNALANPRLELHDTNGTLAGNDDWQTTQLGGIITSDQSAAIRNSGLAPKDPAESAIIATLAPGAYTAIAQGVNGGTGVGLVEVFSLP